MNQPFLDGTNRSFAEGFSLMMEYDQYSMWEYLTTAFALGDMKESDDPTMGTKSDRLSSFGRHTP
jgi:hypothetical protein